MADLSITGRESGRRAPPASDERPSTSEPATVRAGGDAEPCRGSRTSAWLRRFAKLWGFALFCIFVVYVFREVALPFLFAILVAYILAPVVDRLANACGSRGRPFPRGLAVIILYINILARAGRIHRLLHPQAVGRLRPDVPRSARS